MIWLLLSRLPHNKWVEEDCNTKQHKRQEGGEERLYGEEGNWRVRMMKEEELFQKWVLAHFWQAGFAFLLLFFCSSILSSVVQSDEVGNDTGAKGQKRKQRFSLSERGPLCGHLWPSYSLIHAHIHTQVWGCCHWEQFNNPCVASRLPQQSLIWSHCYHYKHTETSYLFHYSQAEGVDVSALSVTVKWDVFLQGGGQSSIVLQQAKAGPAP